jgi:hypothetical protein
LAFHLLVAVAATLLSAVPPSHIQLAAAPAAAVQERPFTVEYYYKVKWGHTAEFLRLYKKNHQPLLNQQQKEGRILQMKMEEPFYHAGEDARWDYRVTIVWKNAAVAHDDYDSSAPARTLFPDQQAFEREEQQRFELLLAHWDVPVIPVDLGRQ